MVDENKISKDHVRKLPNNRLAFHEDTLLFKMLSKDKLGKYLRVIDTGIHSGNVRPKIFFKEAKPNITKKLLQGKQIERWAIWWDSPSAKYKYCDPTYVPQDTLGTGRGGNRPSKSKEYWTYCRGGDEKFHYVPERILMRQTADNIFAAYQNLEEDGQFYTDHTLYTIIPNGDEGNLKYFLGIMNSKLMNYLYKLLSMQEGKILAQARTGLVEVLPIVYDKNREEEVVRIVEEMISRRRTNHGCDLSELEKKLDLLVCTIYELSDEEKKLILD